MASRFRRVLPALAIVIGIAFVACAQDTPGVSTTPPTAAPTTGWSEGPRLPMDRSEFPAAVLDDLLYVAGGFVGPGRVTDSVDRFDPITGEWDAVAPLPESRHHFTLTALDGRLYAGGGYSGEDQGFTDEVWAFDPVAAEWEAVAPLPHPRAAHSASAIDGRIYVVGGISPIPDAGETITVYDPDTDTWSTEGDLMPTKREHVVSVGFEGKLWVIGGRTGTTNTAAVEIYDPASRTWTSAPDLLTATSGHTAAVIANQIHVTGGEDLEGFRVIPDHQVIAAGHESWRLEAPIPTARHGLSSGAVQGRWYVVGGGPGVDLSVSARTDIWATG